MECHKIVPLKVAAFSNEIILVTAAIEMMRSYVTRLNDMIISTASICPIPKPWLGYISLVFPSQRLSSGLPSGRVNFTIQTSLFACDRFMRPTMANQTSPSYSTFLRRIYAATHSPRSRSPASNSIYAFPYVIPRPMPRPPLSPFPAFRMQIRTQPYEHHPTHLWHHTHHTTRAFFPFLSFFLSFCCQLNFSFCQTQRREKGEKEKRKNHAHTQFCCQRFKCF